MIKLLSVEDPKQALRIRRGFYALIGGFLHFLLCLVLWFEGYFHLSGENFIWLFAVFGLIHILFFSLLRSGYNQKFKDPSLTLPMMLWSISCVMITVYLTAELRAAVLIFYLLGLMFGMFHLTWRQFIMVNVYGLSFYLIIIIASYCQQQPELNLKKEAIVYFSYIMISLAFSAICAEINSLRNHLHMKNVKLSEAFKLIESVSITDELTKVKNRRYILNILENQRLMAERGNYVFSVCMIDIDHFKEINDTYGHNTGDEILKAICKNIISDIRRIDHFARYGGEEFLLVLPLTKKAQALEIAGRLQQLIAATNFNDIIPNRKVTLSIGVVEYHWPELIEEMLARVDIALYSAKRHGRNRVVAN